MPETVGFILLLVAGGYLARKLGLVREDASTDLNQLILYLFLPAMIFRALHHAELTWQVAAMPLLGWAGVAIGLAVGFLAGMLTRKLFGLAPALFGTFLLACAFGNTTYLGYPIVSGLFGPEHLTLAMFYDLLGATVAANTLGALVASSSAGQGVPPAIVAKRLLSLPVLWALVLGLASRDIAIPEPLDRTLERIGQLTVPMSMVMMGLALRLNYWRHQWRLALVASGVKLIVGPLAVWGIARSLGLPPAFQEAAVMEAAMPTMFYSLNLVLFFGLDAPFILNVIALSSLLGTITLPAWFWVLGHV